MATAQVPRSGPERLLDHSRATIFLVYFAFAACVAVTCFTNDVLIALIRDLAGLGADWPTATARRLPDAAADRYDEYLLGAVKAASFFASLLFFAVLLWRPVAAIVWPAFGRGKLWRDIGVGALITCVLLFEIVPSGMGRIYGYNSVQPFLQHQGFYHRRILMPALAHLFQLDGVLYAAFAWLIAFAVLALATLYLETRGLVLSRLELASLFTTGILASAFALPGYVEILVLGLTLVAMLDMGRNGRTGIVQPVCFALALLTHETAAVLAFGALALGLFDRRFLLHFVALLGIYLAIWLASYAFDASHAIAVQLTGGTTNFDRFAQTLPMALFSLFAAYKLSLLAAVPAVAHHVAAGRTRRGLMIATALIGGLGLTVIATDYSRMASFGSFALLFALPEALRPLSIRWRRLLAVANLAIPTVYVAARHGIVAYHGLYGLFLRGWIA